MGRTQEAGPLRNKAPNSTFPSAASTLQAPPGLAATRGEYKLLWAQCSWPSSGARPAPSLQSRSSLTSTIFEWPWGPGPRFFSGRPRPAASSAASSIKARGSRARPGGGRIVSLRASLWRSLGAPERVCAWPRLLQGRERGLRRRLRRAARGAREERRERALGCARPVSMGRRARSVAPNSLPPPLPKGPLGARGLVPAPRGGSFDLEVTPPSVPAAVLSPSRPQANSCPGEVATPRGAPRAGHC